MAARTARPALFRLLLATILMLNGIASAIAGVQHAAGEGVLPATSEAANPDPAAGDAHDGCAEPAPGLAGSDSPTSGSSHGTDHSPGPDCCGSGACQCACVNGGLPALLPDMHKGFGIPGQTCARPMASWHAAPALPHLMRPPIS